MHGRNWDQQNFPLQGHTSGFSQFSEGKGFGFQRPSSSQSSSSNVSPMESAYVPGFVKKESNVPVYAIVNKLNKMDPNRNNGHWNRHRGRGGRGDFGRRAPDPDFEVKSAKRKEKDAEARAQFSKYRELLRIQPETTATSQDDSPSVFCTGKLPDVEAIINRSDKVDEAVKRYLQNKLKWFLTPNSSKAICSFVEKFKSERNRLSKSSETGRPIRMASNDEKVMNQALSTFASIQDSNTNYSHSLIGDPDTFPMVFNKRQNDSLLRPVIIDALGVACRWDKTFGDIWEREDGKDSFLKKKVLPVRPLALLASHFLLMGHKVVICVPEYYESVIYSRNGIEVQKVDDIIGWVTLLDAGLINICGEANTDGWTAHLLIETSKTDACLISNGDVRWKASRRYGAYYGVETGQSINERINRSIDRVITPEFVGPNKRLSICMEFTLKIDENEKFDITKYEGEVVESGVKNGNRFIWIGRIVSLRYHLDTSVDFDVRFAEQLKLEDQFQKLDLLSNVVELPVRLLRGCQGMKLIEEWWKESRSVKSATAVSTSTISAPLMPTEPLVPTVPLLPTVPLVPTVSYYRVSSSSGSTVSGPSSSRTNVPDLLTGDLEF